MVLEFEWQLVLLEVEAVGNLFEVVAVAAAARPTPSHTAFVARRSRLAAGAADACRPPAEM